jgi:cytochrome c oxidase subunit IV
MALDIHPPPVVFAMLFALSVACALLAGYGMAGGHERSWTHMLVFAAVIGLTVYVILDLEYPRIGLIRLDAADRLLIELRGSMS